MTRRSVVLIIAILLIVLVAVPWPQVRAQGDAGSGGDAGNTFEAAYPINASVEYNGEIAGGADTEDWYSFLARAGQGIELVARDSFDSVAEIWDPFAVLRALGDDPPVASFLADSTGEWRARIRPYSFGTGTYSFNVRVGPGSIQNDANSGGDAGNTFGTATEVNVSGYYSGQIVGGDPEDWYRFFAASGDTIVLTVYDTFDSVAEIWDPFVAMRGVGDEPPSASVFADVTGEWRSRIRPYSTGTGSYNFTVQLQPGRPQNDANSGRDAGNTFDAAILVLAGTHSGELAFGDSEDWYRIALEAGRRVEVLVRDTFDSIVQIYDPFRVPQGYGDNPPSVSFTAHASGEWRIRVWSYGGPGGSYTVTVTLGPKLADIGLLWYIALGSFTAGGAALAAFAAFWKVPLSPKRPRYPMR